MSNIADFMDEIERLAYKILLWLLLLPKTLLKVILEPKWVPGYVRSELGGERRQAFDNYMSPIVLFLMVTLVPAIMYGFLPTTSIKVYEPVLVSDVTERDIEFSVDGSFISSTKRLFHRVTWEVEGVDQFDQNGNPRPIEFWFDEHRNYYYVDENWEEVSDPTFTFQYGEVQDELDGTRFFTLSDDGQMILDENPSSQADITLLDDHTINSSTTINFPPGEYRVWVTIENYDPENGIAIETLYDVIYLTVYEDDEQSFYAASYYMVSEDKTEGGIQSQDLNAAQSQGLTSLFAVFLPQQGGKSDQGSTLEVVQNGMESGSIYFLALALLSLPLLFSFGTKILGEDGIGESSMKESFYMQCYYFSPVTTAFWATVYSVALYTSDLSIFATLTTFGLFLLVMLWFLFAQVGAIMSERGVTKGRSWGILVMLVTTLAGGSILLAAVLSDLDLLRRNGIAIFPWIGIGIVVWYFIRRRRERKAAQQKAEALPQA